MGVGWMMGGGRPWPYWPGQGGEGGGRQGLVLLALLLLVLFFLPSPWLCGLCVGVLLRGACLLAVSNHGGGGRVGMRKGDGRDRQTWRLRTSTSTLSSCMN